MLIKRAPGPLRINGKVMPKLELPRPQIETFKVRIRGYTCPICGVKYLTQADTYDLLKTTHEGSHLKREVIVLKNSTGR